MPSQLKQEVVAASSNFVGSLWRAISWRRKLGCGLIGFGLLWLGVIAIWLYYQSRPIPQTSATTVSTPIPTPSPKSRAGKKASTQPAPETPIAESTPRLPAAQVEIIEAQDAAYITLPLNSSLVRVQGNGKKFKICKGDTILVNVPGIGSPWGMVMVIGGKTTEFTGDHFSGVIDTEGVPAIRLKGPPNDSNLFRVTINVGRNGQCT